MSSHKALNIINHICYQFRINVYGVMCYVDRVLYYFPFASYWIIECILVKKIT